MEQVHEKHRRDAGAWSQMEEQIKKFELQGWRDGSAFRVCTAITEDLGSVPHTHSEIQGS